MSRSLKKENPFFVHPHIIKSIERMEKKGIKKPIRTYSRSSSIIPKMVGYTFSVHNGKKFHNIYITQDMIAHKLGTLSPTNSPGEHGKAGRVGKK
jgi:small subunit ribosomal protein S19